MEKLLYLEEHVSCKEYSPNILVGFKYRRLMENSDLNEQNKDYHHLIFFLKGEALISSNEYRNRSIKSNEFILK